MTDYQLWLGDCLEEMNRVKDGSIDMILADLPYGTTACAFDKRIPFEPLWAQYKRVIKKNGAIVLFGSEPFSSLLRLSNLDWYKYDWVWEKSKATLFQHANHMPMRNHENILVFYQNLPIYNPQKIFTGIKDKRKTFTKRKNNSEFTKGNLLVQTRKDDGYRFPVTVQYFNNSNRANLLHPTQKPVPLMEYLIKTYTNEGDLILDNTCGSGSTLEAAMRCNRRSIGIEKDEGYFNVASQRLERVAADLRGELNHLPMFAEVA